MASTMPRSALLGADLVWLLSVTYAGRTFRWASRPCAPVGRDGVALPHDGGLTDPVELDEVVSGIGADADTMSLPFEVFFSPDTSVAALSARGHDLAAATGEVSLWAVGTHWEDRRVVLVGSVSEPEWGDVDEPVSFSVEAAPWEDTALVPASTARVTETTWPDAAEDAAGLYYPVVIGAPGVHARGTAPGSPGIYVRYTAGSKLILVAGHEVTATSVTLRDPDGARETLAVTHMTDGLGQTVAVVAITGAATVDPLLVDGEWWVIWDQGGGGMRDAARTGTLAGAGDVLTHFLGLSTLTVDVGRWTAVRAQLNRYVLAGYIDEPVSPWEWLADNVLPLLPMSVRSGPSGAYPVLWRHDAVASDAVDHLVAGPGVVRTSSVSSGRGSDITNEVRFDFAIDAESGDAQGWVCVRGDPDPNAYPDEVSSYHAAVSLARYGAHAEAIGSDVIWDAQTARLVCAWMVAAYWAPARTVSYEVGQEYGWIEAGSVVTLTDASIAMDEQVALVTGVRWLDETGVELTLTVIESMPRDRRG